MSPSFAGPAVFDFAVFDFAVVMSVSWSGGNNRQQHTTPDRVAIVVHVQTVTYKKFAARPAIRSNHHRKDIDEAQAGMRCSEISDHLIRDAHLVDQLPSRWTRLDRHESDTCLR